MNFDTLLIHGGVDGDEQTGAVNVPIYQTSTYRQSAIGQHKGYEYSRTGNPTRHALETLIAELEGGTAGFAFASGMAAITAVLTLFKTGDKMLISSNVYGGTYRVLDKIFKNFGIDYDIVDTNDRAAVLSRMDSSVKAIFVETPANPLMGISDIAEIVEIAHEKGLLTIVDNTFMTPYLQKPISLGADIVVHSATKYLGGHSDLIAGLVVVNNAELAQKIHFIQNSTGGVLGPFDAWLLIKGIKTLAVRLDRHMENAAYIVSRLSENAAVEKLYYPGLKEHPGYETHKRQATGAGAMLSFTLKESYDTNRFLSSLQIITLGESLGGVESLISHPASMTHGSIPYLVREGMGITNRLVRLSVGIESKEDLLWDLENAIEVSRL